MKFVILWTDALVYLLLLGLGIMIVGIFCSSHKKKRWRKILCRPLPLVALMVLSVYSVIGILDTIHFQETLGHRMNTSGIVSLLDKLLEPIALHSERSFSAPFATHAFIKETMVLPNGEIVRDYPRLKYGGEHLSSPEQKWQDIRLRLLRVIMQTLIIGSACGIIILWSVSIKKSLPLGLLLRKIVQGNTLFPWKTFLITAMILIFILLFIHEFMGVYHILGTSQVGIDVLYQTLKSIRTGLIIGTLTTFLTLPFAIVFGITAGYFKGWIDDIIQYIYTTLSSIPGVLLIAAAVLTLQIVMGRHTEWFHSIVERADARLLALCAILGITSWTGLCRLLRGETLKITEMDFIQASHSLGSSNFHILFRHILPNVFHIVLISIALDFSGLVLAEAVLSYVGVGVDPTSFSWGMMINSARLEMARDPIIWWNLSAAFIFMFVLVLAANVFSDALRDAFDPRTHVLGEK